ncbi:MAG: Lrp/AsnC family transcriptional regulator [Methanobacteriota archaeon]|nr:MAG: Lrp/AsnC family transcriptional regulator [Euryarchaeota archaeon]
MPPSSSWISPGYSQKLPSPSRLDGPTVVSVALGRNLNIYKVFRHEIVQTAEMLIDNGTMSDWPRERGVHSNAGGIQADTMTTPTALDELDLRILRLLNADARKSYRDIAKEADASLSTVSNRVRKLEEEGVISGYVPVLNEARLGFDVLAVVGVKIHKGKLLEVQRRIAKDDRVTHVYDVTGEWDSIVVVRLRNTRDLDAFIKRLGSMEYVENTYTQVVLNVVKEERRVLL